MNSINYKFLMTLRTMPNGASTDAVANMCGVSTEYALDTLCEMRQGVGVFGPLVYCAAGEWHIEGIERDGEIKTGGYAYLDSVASNNAVETPHTWTDEALTGIKPNGKQSTIKRAVLPTGKRCRCGCADAEDAARKQNDKFVKPSRTRNSKFKEGGAEGGRGRMNSSDIFGNLCEYCGQVRDPDAFISEKGRKTRRCSECRESMMTNRRPTALTCEGCGERPRGRDFTNRWTDASEFFTFFCGKNLCHECLDAAEPTPADGRDPYHDDRVHQHSCGVSPAYESIHFTPEETERLNKNYRALMARLGIKEKRFGDMA
jgi:hypothetical protein